METKTAYCRRCKRNTLVVDTIPIKYLLFLFILLVVEGMYEFVIAPVEFVPRALDSIKYNVSTLLWLALLILFFKDLVWCGKCGAVIGSKASAKPKCIHCDTDITQGTTFCPNCGKRYRDSADSIVCKKCKTENTPESMFCAKCGTKLQKPKERKTKQKTTDANEWSDWE